MLEMADRWDGCPPRKHDFDIFSVQFVGPPRILFSESEGAEVEIQEKTVSRCVVHDLHSHPLSCWTYLFESKHDHGCKNDQYYVRNGEQQRNHATLSKILS